MQLEIKCGRCGEYHPVETMMGICKTCKVQIASCIKESPSTDVQQLKAEIAALETWVRISAERGFGNELFHQLGEKLRQLTAV